jgi:hypothetical protein
MKLILVIVIISIVGVIIGIVFRINRQHLGEIKMDQTMATYLPNCTPIDTKVVMTAVNPCNGNVYTQYNAILLSAKDRCVIPALEAYLDACVHENADMVQIESVENLIERVKEFQSKHGVKTPDIDSDCEVEMVFQDTKQNFKRK